MGSCRKGKVVWKIQRPTRPAHLGANELLLASAQQRWEETVRDGSTGARVKHKGADIRGKLHELQRARS